MVAEVHIDSF